MHATPSPRVLVLEDDRTTRTFLADNLAADGFEPVVTDNLIVALRRLEVRRFDAAIVDVGLQDGSGLDLLRRVRGADGTITRLDPRLPIIVLSGRAAELDRLRAFEAGCDDYVLKPFSYGELRWRLVALLRRAHPTGPVGRVRIGSLEVDPGARQARIDGVPVALSQKEFALLRTLAGEPMRVFTKGELLRDVWGFRAGGSTRTLDSHACRLRRKLMDAGVGHCVVNVWGVGYRLVDDVPETAGAA